jgi:hypothetical protein
MEIPLIELLWNKWFGIMAIVMFGCGIIFATAMPFFKWDLYRAEIYCELLNTLDRPYGLDQSNTTNNHTVAQLASAKINNRQYRIRWSDEENKFTVEKRPL